MGGAQLPGQFQPVGVQVHGDNGRAASDPRRHDCRQPNRADAENDDAAADFRPERVEHRACTGLDATAQWTEQREIDVLRHFHRIALGGQRVSGERGLAEEPTTHLLLTTANQCAAIQSPAGEVQRHHLLAVGRGAT
ncbi:hypothetical protein D3C84_542500 [compost metagenome]